MKSLLPTVNIIFITAGILVTAFSFRKLFYSLTLIVIVAFLISVNYGILDIQEYFLLIFFGFSIFWAICIHFLLSIKKISGNLPVMIAIPALCQNLFHKGFSARQRRGHDRRVPDRSRSGARPAKAGGQCRPWRLWGLFSQSRD